MTRLNIYLYKAAGSILNVIGKIIWRLGTFSKRFRRYTINDINLEI